MTKINWTRFIIGGLVATVIMFLTDGLLHEHLLHPDWEAVYAQLKTEEFRTSHGLAVLYFLVFELGRGMTAMLIYVLMRPFYGAGPKTAVIAAIAGWIAFSVTGPAQFIPLGFYTTALWGKVAGFHLVTSVLATLAGAALYKVDAAEVIDLQNFQIYKNLAWLNELPDDEAEAVFRDCCGSREWARRMIEARPFRLLENLFAAAENIWFQLAPLHKLEAYSAHSSIEEAVPTGVSKELAETKRLYEEKIRFIFVVYPLGKSPEEILAICRARLGNSVETELRIAAEEQRKITEARLNELLER